MCFNYGQSERNAELVITVAFLSFYDPRSQDWRQNVLRSFPWLVIIVTSNHNNARLSREYVIYRLVKQQVLKLEHRRSGFVCNYENKVQINKS